MEESVRRSWHCGWLGPDLWTDPGPPKTVGGKPHGLDICPGYVARLPGVNEAARAHLAFKQGELTTFFPDPSNALLEAVEECEHAFNEYRNQKMRERKERDPGDV